MLIKMIVNKMGRDNTVGAIREFTAGQTYDVNDTDLVKVFIDNGWAEDAGTAATDSAPAKKVKEAPVEEESVDEEGGGAGDAVADFLENISGKTVQELRDFAEEHGIEIPKTVTKKSDIAALIQGSFDDEDEGFLG
jgi:hypothetical protein